MSLWQTILDTINPRKAGTKYFIKSVIIILSTTAGLKFYASVIPATTTYLDRQDEVLWFFSHRQLLMLAAFFETGIVLLLIRRNSDVKRLRLIAWCGCIFLAYRSARRAGHFTTPCGCLGVLAGPYADLLSKAALGWMLGGSILLMLRHLVLLWTPDRDGKGTQTISTCKL
jgi:hypothetical protein